MPIIDLTRYIVASNGTWTHPNEDNLFGFTLADTRSPGQLMLRWSDDFVALTGPLRVRVTVQAENMTVPLGLLGNLVPDAAATMRVNEAGGPPVATLRAGTLNESALGRVGTTGRFPPQASTIYSYTLDIDAGQAWPFSLSDQLAALRLYHRSPHWEQLGNNLGLRVLIAPWFADPECRPASTVSDLPCDFAIADRPDTARFFPVPCEPCDGSVTGLPPSGAVALVTPPAAGGCVRTRPFNGMFITREDLETEQRYHRTKFKLHNQRTGCGAAWGFGVHKHGGYVCVLPGYGIDCCGNDLTITSTYKVDIAALLADPAAAPLLHKRGEQCLHLLLEYVECPCEPRPVHGDPCAAEASRCEMSRIRESVRLRLVPPCDHNPATPIQKFLDEVRNLRTRFPLGASLAPAGAIAPFQLRFTVGGSTAPPVMVRPSPLITTVSLPPGTITSLTIDIVLDPLWTFVQGNISAQAFSPQGKVLNGVVQPPEPVDLSLAKGFNAVNLQTKFSMPSTGTVRSAKLTYKLSNWQAQTFLAGEEDVAPSGDLTITLPLGRNINQPTLLVETPIALTQLNLAQAPCAGAPCTTPRPPDPDCGPAGAAFADTAHPSSGGDPKALALAALVGWLSQMMVREQAGTANEITSARREGAQVIYRLAWSLLFGVSQKADPAALGGSLQRLLEGWCDSMLWNGPRCCCEPHGVPIGCAVVSGGTILRIDPFAGRRHVIQYPVLEHWGRQFGIASPDIAASHFFSKLCCLAGLPAPAVGGPHMPSALIPLGGGFLAVGDPQDISNSLQQKRKQIVAQRRVSTAEMIVTALTLIGSQPVANTLQFTALLLDDFVADGTVLLLLPAS